MNKTLGNVLLLARHRAGLTQRDLADRLNIHFTYISKIENDKVDLLPSDELIRCFADELQLDADALIEISGKLQLDQLQRVAKNNPVVAEILRHIQQDNLTDEQLSAMQRITLTPTEQDAIYSVAFITPPDSLPSLSAPRTDFETTIKQVHQEIENVSLNMWPNPIPAYPEYSEFLSMFDRSKWGRQHSGDVVVNLVSISEHQEYEWVVTLDRDLQWLIQEFKMTQGGL